MVVTFSIADGELIGLSLTLSPICYAAGRDNEVLEEFFGKELHGQRIAQSVMG